jgi:hypothetical protein
VALGNSFYHNGFSKEFQELKGFLERYYPLTPPEFSANSVSSKIQAQREVLSKSLFLEFCKQSAFRWGGNSFDCLYQSLSFSHFSLNDIDAFLEAIRHLEEGSLQQKILQHVFLSLEAFITSDHEFKIYILKKIYQFFYKEKEGGTHDLIRIAEIYQQSARNVEASYTDPLFLEICQKLSQDPPPRELFIALLNRELKQLKPFAWTPFALEFQGMLQGLGASSFEISLSEVHEIFFKWLEESQKNEQLDFEKFPEILVFLRRSDEISLSALQKVVHFLQNLFQSKTIQSKISFEYLPLFYWVPQILREFLHYQLFQETDLFFKALLQLLWSIENYQKQKMALVYLNDGLTHFLDGDDKVLVYLQKLFKTPPPSEYIKNRALFLANLYFLCDKIKSSALKETLIYDAKEAIVTNPTPEVRYLVYTL